MGAAAFDGRGEMDALDEYLAWLREQRGVMSGDVPRFSDKDGRTAARVLFLFQDPGNSGAARSGVVDRCNDGPSAKAFRKANKGVLDREETVSWNAIPWAMQGTVADEKRLVREWRLIPRLLDALPEVRVVLFGNVARDFTVDVYAYGADANRGLLVLHGPHPSSRGLQADRELRFSREQR